MTPTEIDNAAAAEIRAAAARNRLTIKNNLAPAAHLSRNAASDRVNGKTPMTVGEFVRLAEAAGETPAAILSTLEAK